MNNVRFLQEQRGMTQDEFAEYCDIPRISIARYETLKAMRSNRTGRTKKNPDISGFFFFVCA